MTHLVTHLLWRSYMGRFYVSMTHSCGVTYFVGWLRRSEVTHLVWCRYMGWFSVSYMMHSCGVTRFGGVTRFVGWLERSEVTQLTDIIWLIWRLVLYDAFCGATRFIWRVRWLSWLISHDSFGDSFYMTHSVGRLDLYDVWGCWSHMPHRTRSFLVTGFRPL